MLPNPEIQAELRLHEDVQTLDDEWSGITDPVIRRKLQNRLNQRAARKFQGGPFRLLGYLLVDLQIADPTTRTTQG